MSQQLVKKGANGKYSNVNPKSWTEAIKDKNTGQNLVEILQGFNMYFLSYTGDKESTRCLVPNLLRKKGLWITYVDYDGIVYTEWYDANSIKDDSWENSSNWRDGSNMLVGDISISSNGNWVINGVETNHKATGERGYTPILRVGDNNKLQASYDGGYTFSDISQNSVFTQFAIIGNKLNISDDLGKTWKPISEYIASWFRVKDNKLEISRDNTTWSAISEPIASWFRWEATEADSQANNLGRLQISRDNRTWNTLSGDIINNLHISKYIGADDTLPTTGIPEGTIYAKGPTYAEDDTLNENPIYRLWVYAWKDDVLAWVDNGEFTSIAAGIVQETGDSENAVMSQKAVSTKLSDLASEVYGSSFNLYNPSLQTPETISPHYYYDGEPYSSTQFDSQYNATALFELEGNTEYSLGLVPKYGSLVKPWGDTNDGLFFYDKNKKYISKTANTTFTTPNGTRYARFNYSLAYGITLEKLNAMCMLVEGSELPSKYSPYSKHSLNEKIDEINTVVKNDSQRIETLETSVLDLNNELSSFEESLSGLVEYEFEKMTIFDTYTNKVIQSDGSLIETSLFNTNIYEVSETEPYRVTGQFIGSSVWLYAYYSGIPSQSTLVELGKNSNNVVGVHEYEFDTIAPKNAKYLAVTVYNQQYENLNIELHAEKKVKKTDISETINSLNKKIDNLYTVKYKELSYDKLIDGVFLNGDGNMPTLEVTQVKVYKVKEGDKVKIKANYNMGVSRMYVIYSSYDILNSSTKIYAGDNVSSSYEVDIVIPKGAVCIAVEEYKGYPVITSIGESELAVQNAEELKPLHVKYISENEISVTRRYDATRDIQVTLKKFGANNLMQLQGYGFVENDSFVVSSDNPSKMVTSGSDWVGPYVMKADNREGSYNGFTGGCHGYNGDATGAPTARTKSVEVFIDERTPKFGMYRANGVRVIVTNEIQGGNTKNIDGTGIAILEEVVTYEFINNRINISTIIKAIEPLTIKTYYGMQFNSFNDSIKFYSDIISGGLFSENPSTSNKNINYLICSNSNGEKVKGLLNVEGLGHKKYSNIYTYAFVSGNKAYFSLIDQSSPLTLSEGEETYWSGYYEFFK